ncbi:hypothetical protein N0V93_000501 [Gnomoniopsis smithogilvyi]|uniref:Uncharacterized protein n=1 Tax=Gnomoniopsis smithogilvyi TaxID=1191159 RepID=A0A9W8Z447_9PEZI|nr:hypothetical protein N0V93_000501 [Gnomoniopsis smithogilvyi]
MATKSDEHLAETEVQVDIENQWIVKDNDLSNSLISAELIPERNCKHLFTATARLNGKGECNAWFIKPELADLDDYDQFELGPQDPRDLMHEVFDWPRAGLDRNDTTKKGVKFLQQLDMNHDYLEEELEDVRDHAWVVLFRSIHVNEKYRRQGVGTALVRAFVQEISRLAQLEERPVLAFTKLEKSALRPEMRSSSPGLSPNGRRDGQIQEAKVQTLFWQSLAFERLNDGQLFAKDMDWLVWSPRARNAALLFERAAAFPIDFDALIEDHLYEYKQEIK